MDLSQQIAKYRFKKKKQLAKHMLQIHENPAKFECKFCSKNFIKEKQYEVHMQRHEDKIQKKNMQIVDLSEQNTKTDPAKEETKEIDFEDSAIKKSIESLLDKKNFSPFTLEFGKEYKCSDSERSINFKNSFAHRPSSLKLNSPMLQ
mmetsp:Transcript_22054/g.19621  ORF Transcript_22054/g.19621 Transcript_22054/m.19621 type:complete len:147 (+) Transcript_22054:312-752(+)